GFSDPSEPQDDVLATADVGWWPLRSLLVAVDYRARFESSSATSPAKQNLAGPRVVYRVDDMLDIFAGSLHSVSGKNALHGDPDYVGVTTKRNRLSRLQGFLGGTKY